MAWLFVSMRTSGAELAQQRSIAALLGNVPVLEAVFMLRCNTAITGAQKAHVTASVVTSSRLPLLKYQLGRDGIFHRNSCKERLLQCQACFRANPAQSYLPVSFHPGWPTERFEHGRLVSVSRFCPIDDVSQLCKDLSLETRQIHQ